MTPNEALDHLSLYSPHILPDVNTYGMIVDIAIKWANNPLEGPHFAQAVLDCMNKEAKTNPGVLPGTVMFNTVLDAWAKSGMKEAPYKAEDILQAMQDFAQFW
ncbi:MAG: hypothetical protein WCF43_05115 [Steroidobacteraceae bacterium]